MQPDLFNRHALPPANGTIFDSYIVTGVIGSIAMHGGSMRTLVLRVRHLNDKDNTPLVAKIVFESRFLLEQDMTREFLVHYFLTQNDATAVRAAAARHTDGDGLFVVGSDPVEEHRQVRQAIWDTTVHNVVPLLDFWIGPFMKGDLRVDPGASEPELSPLQKVPKTTYHVAVSIQRPFTGTLRDHLFKVPLNQLAYQTRWVLGIVMLQLHSLMAIGFSHGDLHAQNIGVATGTGPRHYKHIVSAGNLNVPVDVPQPMLFDFGFSHASFVDARGVRRVYSPSSTLMGARIGARVEIDDYLMSPTFDIFRLCLSLLQIIARRIVDQDMREFFESPGANELMSVLHAGLRDTTKTKNIIFIPAESTYADYNAKVKLWLNLPAKEINAEWITFLKTQKKKLDIESTTLPYDILQRLRLPASSDGVGPDMTLRPQYAPGKVYNPSGGGAGARVDSLTTFVSNQSKV